MEVVYGVWCRRYEVVYSVGVEEMVLEYVHRCLCVRARAACA